MDNRGKHTQFTAAILFFVCIALLFGYLLAVRLSFPVPTAVFWIVTFIPIIIVVFQITRIPWPGYEGILLVEILVLGVALHAVYQIPFYGIDDSDSYENMMVVRKILEQGIVIPARPASESIAFWPLSKLYGAQLNYLTGIDTFAIAKWFSLITSSIFILLMYVLSRRVFKSEKIALFTVLLMVSLQYFSMFGSKFHNENIALIIMMAGLFSLTRVEGNTKSGFVALSVLCLFGVILAHHLTPLMLMLFLLLSLGIRQVLVRLNRERQPGKTALTITPVFALLAFVGVFCYWLYVFDEPFRSLVQLGYTLLTGQLGTAGSSADTMGILQPETIPTLRGRITFYGYYSFLAVFAIILFYKVVFRPKNKSTEFYSFAAFLTVCGVIVVLRMYFLTATAGNIPPDRLFTWGWIFGFAPLVISMLENRSGWRRQLGIGLLAGFMIFNVYTTPENAWNFQEPGRPSGDIVLKEDYALAVSLPLPGQGTAYHKTRLAIFDVRGYFSMDLRLVPDIVRLEAMDWIVIKKKELEKIRAGRTKGVYNPAVLDRLEELSMGSSDKGRDRIYESDNLIVFKRIDSLRRSSVLMPSPN